MKSLSKGRNSTPCDRDVVRRGMRRRHMTRDARRGGQNMGRTLQLGTGMGDRLFRMIPLVIEVSMGQSKALDSGESEPLLRKIFLSFGWWFASILVPDGARLLEGVTTSNYCSELGIHSHSMASVLPSRYSSCAQFSVSPRAECRQVTPCRVSSASGTKVGAISKTFSNSGP